MTSDAFMTDLYQLAMTQAYLETGKEHTAVFEFFVRKLPSRRGFLVAAGLEQALDYLEQLRFTDEDIDWLRQTGRFGDDLLDYLADFRFTGDVDAISEGTVVFADEPILRVTASLPEAQLVETRLVNLLHFQTLIASKAARFALIAPERALVDFGFRRAHGAEAGLLAARASYLAGFSSTATVLAGARFGIPTVGTMAHSFVEAFDSEMEAFEAFARARPEHLTLLVDTYDVGAGVRKVVELAPKLAAEGVRIGGIRIDSGNLSELAKLARRILDEGGLTETTVFVSGGIDEAELRHMIESGVPIGGFGIGTSLTTSFDLPALDCAYKLQEYAGIARRKLSSGKATWPGRKQVWRRHAPDGTILGDVLSLEDDPQEGKPLLLPAMRGGKRLGQPTLGEARRHARAELATLPEPLRRLEQGATVVAEVAPALRRLAEVVDQRLRQMI